MELTTETQFIKSLDFKKEEIRSYQSFPLNLPVVRNFSKLIFHPNVTYIVGENGMGKSTLLEGIAVQLGFNPEGGTLNFNFSNYDSHSNLDQYMRIVKGAYRPKDHFFLRAETFYNLATNIEELDKDPVSGPKIVESFGGKSLHKQSHGESFFAAFNHRFQGNGLYILDEPEAALSPIRQLSMVSRMHELVQQGSQFIISTHSPLLMAYPKAKIIELGDTGMKEVNLEDTGHFSTMK
ncbi:AAA family ATPase [Halobacillus salinarum]|uniref:AAA family ATPase n=1 Tax=Halobacillus salinarum TaxID=2932257 RepID=A0ABY4EPD5_9BACI|nr:AAA family ATPase [Halobacillus salinarum]UOQ45946.1 AAA family ATPase [Halobacillus salinarum]